MWLYKDKEINNLEDCPEAAIGYIYKITNVDTNRFYIGKKLLSFSRRTKITRKEKEKTKSRKTFKTTIKDSGWQNYWSSCIELKEDVKTFGENTFVREIIEFCFSKRELSYKEVFFQFKYEVLENNTYNGNIASRWFRKKNNMNESIK